MAQKENKEDNLNEYNLEEEDQTPEPKADRKVQEDDSNQDEDEYPEVEYILPEDDPEEKRKNEGNYDSFSEIFLLLFHIMTNPVSGWKELRRSKLQAGTLVVKMLLPLCIIAGLSDFLMMLYDSNQIFADTAINCVFTIFTYFLSYYIAIVLCLVFLPKASKKFPTSRYGEMLACISVSTLALFHIAEEVLPIFDMILVFLPLWTIYLIFKGMGFVKMSESKSTYTLGVVCVALICSPLLVSWAFSFIQ